MNNLTKKLLIQALDHSPSGTLVVDGRDDRHAIVYANDAFADLTGWDPGELCGRVLTDFVISGDMPAPGAECVHQEWRCRGSGPRQLPLRLVPLYQRPGLADYWMLAHGERDAGGHHDRRRTVASRTDLVTGLANRRAFEETLNRDWGMARRDERPVALIIFRIDAWDSYRAVFGRHSEDACLRKVAHAIHGALHRAGDLAARLDADRFAVLIGGATEAQAADFALDIAARVRRLAIHHPRSPVARFVTVAFGAAALVPQRDQSAEQLIDRALASLDSGRGLADQASRA